MMIELPSQIIVIPLERVGTEIPHNPLRLIPIRFHHNPMRKRIIDERL